MVDSEAGVDMCNCVLQLRTTHKTFEFGFSGFVWRRKNPGIKDHMTRVEKEFKKIVEKAK